MPLELAFDLATLALYDIVIYADDSTSMQYSEGMHLHLTVSLRTARFLSKRYTCY